MILSDGKIIETANVAGDPLEAFEIPDAELLLYEDEAIASWHTHPGVSSQLSFDDFEGFLMWPQLKHYIVGNDGVACYVVRKGAVVIDG